MPDFDFEHLDDKNFERMGGGLCAEHIARGLRIFGTGTDGGREATFEGKTHYPSPADPWEGYIVAQCKQKQTPTGATPKEETNWALGQLDKEMKRYETAKKKRRIPDYYLFITNARMSAQQDTGGKDRFVERLHYWVKRLKMKDADVWDRDKLNNLVDITPKIAERFGLLHTGNLIHYVASAFLSHQAGVETTLSVFLQDELKAEQTVQLGQAGHTDGRPTQLARVFVDLQATPDTNPAKHVHVVKYVQEVSDRPLHPTLLKEERQAYREAFHAQVDPEEETQSEEEPLELLDEEEQTHIEAVYASIPDERYEQSRFVIVGGPGQGKTTLGQQLAQRHRAALLREITDKTLESGTIQLIQEIEWAAAESAIGLPTYPRWPFRIVLDRFAKELAKGEVKSVLDYIAALVRRRSKRDFTPQDAELLLTNMPVFIAFDGLDEVPATSNRPEVLDAVRRFLLEARDKDADLLVIATTRPQGYQGDFTQFDFNQLTLNLLSPEEALVYARKFVGVRYAADTDRQDKIMLRLEAALREEAVARLMRSPLQVTIMASLVDSIGILPRDRYTLFERYYEIVYNREQEKEFTLSSVLSEYRTTIEILHDRIGLLLQVEAEYKGNTDSRITSERLKRLVHSFLVQKEFEEEDLARLTTSFMAVAIERLVFIVPLEDERYGFEVRSLQEFSAARALMRGDYSIVKKRLLTIAPIAYWRNTVLFAMGQAFAKQNEQQSDMVLQLCDELDDSVDPLLSRTQAGSRLALDILEDGIVDLQPDYRKKFVRIALRVIQLPHEHTATRLVGVYTNRDEVPYKKALQAAISDSEEVSLLAPFALLAKLAPEGTPASWAESFLHRNWPTELAQQQLLLEKLAKLFDQDSWFKNMASRVAEVSRRYWVGVHLAEVVELTWIRDASRLLRHRQRRVGMAGQENVFTYRYDTVFLTPPQKEVLDRLEQHKVVEYDWLPFTLGRAFMLEPTPENLADLLEALVQSGSWAPNRFYDGLPWHLEALLIESESTDELLQHAQRARAGELGTAQDWLKAEARWRTARLTVEDLTIFSDADWPYTGEIARCGMTPLNAYTAHGGDYTQDDIAKTVLQAFATTTSKRYRPHLAAGFLFVAGNSYNPTAPFVLPIVELEVLVQATNWQVYVMDIMALLDPGLDWIGEVQGLNMLGDRISVLGNFDRGHEVIEFKRLPEAVAQIVPLVGTIKVREGILRFLAACAVVGTEVPVPLLDPAKLTADGKVAWATINLYSSTPLLTATSLGQLMLSVWAHPHPRTGIEEMHRVLWLLLDRSRVLPPVVIGALSELYTSSEVSARIKMQIISCFIAQIQYRTSALDNPERRAELATEWLFEVLSQ